MNSLRVPPLLVNLALAFATVVVFVAAVEGVARWTEPQPAQAPELIRGWQEWRDDFYRFGQSPPHWPPDGDINRDGLRDRHHTWETPEGTQRLLLLGDSVTYGFGIEARNAFPQALQRLLDERGERLEVFNVAAPGWTTRQERKAYELMRPYGARQAVLAVCLNDPLEMHQNLSRPPAWLARLYGHSALLRRVVSARERETRSVEDMQRAPDSAVARDAFARFFDEVRVLRAELQRDGVSLGLVVLPYRFQMQSDGPALLQARIESFARHEQLPFQDLLPALRPLGEAGFIDYCHLSPRAMEAVAQALLHGPLLPSRTSYAALLEEQRCSPSAPTARLLPILEAPRAELRAAAAWALQRTTLDEDAQRVLARRLTDASESVRIEALRTFSLGRPPALARAAFLQTLVAGREPERLEAARALWAWPPDAADAPRLVLALAQPDAYVRAFAEEALARLGARAVAAVTPALGHEDVTVRRRAARLLGRIGPAAVSAAPSLAQCLVDADAVVRRQAAQALGQIDVNTPASVAALQRAARQDDDAQVRAAALAALERVQRGAP